MHGQWRSRRQSALRVSFWGFTLLLIVRSLQLYIGEKLNTKFVPIVTRRNDWDDAPIQCAELVNNPKPFGSNKKVCARNKTLLEFGDFRCKNGEVAMFSQYGQDNVLYTQHFRYLKRPGNYIDIAANEAVYISNTYFFDRCLGWSGLCVEGNPQYFEKIYRLRSCTLVPTCVSSKIEDVEFLLHGGLGGIKSTNKHSRKWSKSNEDVQSLKLHCTTIATELRRYGSPQVIDYASVDVEGHELAVLEGIDWNAVKINVLSIEVSKETYPAIKQLMDSVGYSELETLLDGRPTKQALTSDVIFLAPGVVFGKPI